MAARRRTSIGPRSEPNLAPLMNMVMILIPLLLLSTVFVRTGVVNVSAPSHAVSSVDDPAEPPEVEAPQVVVFVSSDGFRLDTIGASPDGFAAFTAPVAGCPEGGEAPATICLHDDVPASAALVERLDFAGLYDQLVRVRMHPDWFDAFGREGAATISLAGDPEVPFEVLIETMDTARTLLDPRGVAGAPTASTGAAPYLLGADGAAGAEARDGAAPVRDERGTVPLFGDAVLLMPQG